TYGEDPFLSGVMGRAYVRGLATAHVVATPKHLVANVGEGGRDSYPIEWNERELRERFLPPFEATLRPGAASSVMSAYNSVNGLPATQNPWLLTTLLRHEWGFDGVAISDMAATGGPTVLQMTEPNTPAAAAHAWQAGLDVVFQSTWAQHRPYLAAIAQGLVPMPVIDSAVARVLRLKFQLGLFDERGLFPRGDDSHRAFARRAAAAGMVLLKNDRNTLPLRGAPASVAVIGVDATEGRLGGYSGPGTGTVSTLQGIRNALPRVRVTYAPGPGRVTPEWEPIPATAFRSGLSGEYFTNIDLAGTPALRRTDPQVDFAWTLSTPGEGIANDWFSARWTGTLTAPTGLTALGVEGDDGYRLWIDGRLAIDRWTPGTHRATFTPFRAIAGSRHTLKLEFKSGVPNARVRLVWKQGPGEWWRRRIAEAVAAARRSSVAVVVAGIEEGEFRDRSSLALPGHQEELIRAVAATGKPTIVVLIGGSAITMSRWLDDVDAVLMAWYPGQEGGNAVADVLTGAVDPGGRLPITFPNSEGQLPLSYDHRPTGRGDDYVDGTGEPLFPFGFGLSYATFEYSGLRVESEGTEGTLPLTVRATITNRSTRAGTEVVQLYIHDEVATLSRPVMQLRGFQRVHLSPGDSTEVTFRLRKEYLAFWGNERGWITEPGSFRLMIGASSKDIRLQTHWTLR
ncbi:MAG TPA: glycoside hydrolase family 3 C-terminal domain-containing protein, partial [Gemmatimonadales bacterium]|nr:glycoside hydrolase family 3 C-terminal domain-containing protein [Gemmatimonadales bacterium]